MTHSGGDVCGRLGKKSGKRLSGHGKRDGHQLFCLPIGDEASRGGSFARNEEKCFCIVVDVRVCVLCYQEEAGRLLAVCAACICTYSVNRPIFSFSYRKKKARLVLSALTAEAQTA